jgi:hypothetical protein
MVQRRILRFAKRFLCGLANLSLIVFYLGGSTVASDESEVQFTPEIPFEFSPRKAVCPIEQSAALDDPAPVFQRMATGPELAVACVAFLEQTMPGWHQADGAKRLVAPFVSFLLGDGTARGLERHTIFIDLLGHLEKIAPDWRHYDSVHGLMSQMILGSVVADPFVADFWSTTLSEMDPDWRGSDAAEALRPAVYQLALEEEWDRTGPINQRPKRLLKDLSWASYTKLILATRVFDTWPKRILWISLALLMLFFAARRLRRRLAPT